MGQRLESSQVYGGGPYLNTTDHPAEQEVEQDEDRDYDWRQDDGIIDVHDD